MLALEEGQQQPEESTDPHRFHGIPSHYKLFKWFITINILILLVFCGYALLSLYQLESAMRSKVDSINIDRYLDERTNQPAENDPIVSDFHDWRKSILDALEDDKNNDNYNLKLLLHTITSIVKNFVDDKSVVVKNNLIITNLTDFEIHILKEFTKLKMGKVRLPRTVRGGDDESGCNVNISIDPGDGKVRAVIKSAAKGEGHINVKNTVNWSEKESAIQECSFNIVYEPVAPKNVD